MKSRPSLGTLLIRPALTVRIRIQAEIEAAGFDDFRITHQNVFAFLTSEGIRIGDLATRAQLSKQAMTELVGYLEARGYVARSRDAADGRAWLVRRTERGEALHKVAQRALRATEREWSGALGKSDFQRLLDLLARLPAG